MTLNDADYGKTSISVTMLPPYTAGTPSLVQIVIRDGDKADLSVRLSARDLRALARYLEDIDATPGMGR